MGISSKNAVFNLQDCLESGIIEADEVQELVMKSRKEKILSSHPYAFTPPPREGGRWQTVYKDADGKAHSIRGHSKAELVEKLLPYYFANGHTEKMTYWDLFQEWTEFKKNLASDNTVLRHKQHYAKYLKSSKLHEMTIRNIDGVLLEEECNRIVKEYHLTSKEWANLKTILKGTFEYAKRKNYIKEDPMPGIRILVKFKQVNRKTGKTETFNTDELAEINAYLDKMYEQTHETCYMAIRLNFFLGLRVGELVALKWEDYERINQLHIVREEIRNQATRTFEVVDHTKTNSDRYVTLVPKAIKILQAIPHTNEYIFTKYGERCTANQIAYVLRKYAKHTGHLHKSSHKMRKTFASMLNASGVPLDEIRKLLGHTDINTTLKYLYNPLTDKETYQLMTKAL